MIAIWTVLVITAVLVPACLRQAFVDDARPSAIAQEYGAPPRWIDDPVTRTLLAIAGADARVAYGTGEQGHYAVAGSLLLVPFMTSSFGGYELFSLMLRGDHVHPRAMVAGLAVGTAVLLIDRSILQPHERQPRLLSAARVGQAIVLGALFGLLVATQFFSGSIERYQLAIEKEQADRILNRKVDVTNPDGTPSAEPMTAMAVANTLRELRAQVKGSAARRATLEASLKKAMDNATFSVALTRTGQTTACAVDVANCSAALSDELLAAYQKAIDASPEVQKLREEIRVVDALPGRVESLSRSVDADAITDALNRSKAAESKDADAKVVKDMLARYNAADDIGAMLWGRIPSPVPGGTTATEGGDGDVGDVSGAGDRVADPLLLVLIGLAVLVLDLCPLIYKLVFLRDREHDRALLEHARRKPFVDPAEADRRKARMTAEVDLRKHEAMSLKEIATVDADLAEHLAAEGARASAAGRSDPPRTRRSPAPGPTQQPPPGDHDGGRATSTDDDEPTVDVTDPSHPPTSVPVELLNVGGRPVTYQTEPIGGGGLGTIHRATTKQLTGDAAWVAGQAVIKRPLAGYEIEFGWEIGFYDRHARSLPTAAPDSMVIVNAEDPAESVLLLRYYPCEGLHRFLDGGGVWAIDVPVWLVVTWLYNLVDVLAELWDRNLVHGDGKPDNTLVNDGGLSGDLEIDLGPLRDFYYEKGSAGTLRLCDFSTTAPDGSPPNIYMSPYTPPEYLGPSSVGLHRPGDVFSYLGGVGWWLLTGQHPPKNTAGRARMADLAVAINPILEAVPELVDTIAGWLDPDPTRRVPVPRNAVVNHLTTEVEQLHTTLLGRPDALDVRIHQKVTS